MRMRVVAGHARGRPLRAPAGSGTRPTSDRVRESVFNILTSMDVIEGAAVVDLFAGSGALGIEALSRGAASAVFVDASRPAIEVIRANLGVLDDPASGHVVCIDAIRWLRGSLAAPPVDVVFADPPYAWDDWGTLLALIAGRARWLVAETGADLDPGPEWETARSRRYGTTLITVARAAPSSSPGQAEDPDLQLVSLPTFTPRLRGDT
jgi:16S rRNA (guanine966-N2)-methyltransferase